MAEIISISLDQEAQEMWERNKDFIEKNYGGKSGLFKQKLNEVDDTSALKAEYEHEKAKLEKQSQRVSKLEAKLEEQRKQREEKKKINKLKELLEEKKQIEQFIEEFPGEDNLREEIREEKKEDLIRNNREDRVGTDSFESYIEKRVESKLSIKARKEERLEELSCKIQELKNEFGSLEPELSVQQE